MNLSKLTELEIESLGWGVYAALCRECGKSMAIVATVHSVENGYAEAFLNGQPICQVCLGMNRMVWN